MPPLRAVVEPEHGHGFRERERVVMSKERGPNAPRPFSGCANQIGQALFPFNV